MRIRITPGSGPPVYQQIVRQVQYLIAAGRLVPGDALPPIRDLAEQLLINPNTVARAYRELEGAGLVTSRVGYGTTVRGGPSPLARRERLRLLDERVDALLAAASQLDFTLEDVVRELRKRHEDMKERPSGREARERQGGSES